MTSANADHLTAGELVRRLDEQLEPGEQARVELHLLTCGACRDALAETRALSARISRILLMTDVPASPPAQRAPGTKATRPRVPLARAAMILLALTLAGLAAGPLRAWVQGTWSALRGGWVERPAARAPAVPGPRPGAEGGSDLSVSFTPPGSRLIVDLEFRQGGGTLTVGAGEGDRVRATIEGGDGAEEFLVLPDRLGIRNGPSSSASYRVLVPRAIREVEVRIGGRTSDVLHGEALADGAWRIAL